MPFDKRQAVALTDERWSVYSSKDDINFVVLTNVYVKVAAED